MAWTRKSSVPQRLLDVAEGLVHRRVIGHVAFDEEIDAHLGGQRLDALLERFALIGKGNLGALGVPAPWRFPRRSSCCWRRP